jgi:hypothetical protein
MLRMIRAVRSDPRNRLGTDSAVADSVVRYATDHSDSDSGSNSGVRERGRDRDRGTKGKDTDRDRGTVVLDVKQEAFNFTAGEETMRTAARVTDIDVDNDNDKSSDIDRDQIGDEEDRSELLLELELEAELEFTSGNGDSEECGNGLDCGSSNNGDSDSSSSDDSHYYPFDGTSSGYSHYHYTNSDCVLGSHHVPINTTREREVSGFFSQQLLDTLDFMEEKEEVSYRVDDLHRESSDRDGDGDREMGDGSGDEIDQKSRSQRKALTANFDKFKVGRYAGSL